MIRWLRGVWRRLRAVHDYDWRRVPPPNWRARRWGRDYM